MPHTVFAIIPREQYIVWHRRMRSAPRMIVPVPASETSFECFLMETTAWRAADQLMAQASDATTRAKFAATAAADALDDDTDPSMQRLRALLRSGSDSGGDEAVEARAQLNAAAAPGSAVLRYAPVSKFKEYELELERNVHATPPPSQLAVTIYAELLETHGVALLRGTAMPTSTDATHVLSTKAAQFLLNATKLLYTSDGARFGLVQRFNRFPDKFRVEHVLAALVGDKISDGAPPAQSSE